MRLSLVLLLTCSSACLHHDTPIPLVRHHAERDLDCPTRDIVVTEEVGGKYKAVGCGRKVRYQAACVGVRCEVRPEGESVIPWKDRPDPR